MADPLKNALQAAEPTAPLDMGCVAAHGNFFRTDGGTTIEPSTRAATAFLLELIARLQAEATVPMIDIRAYAKFLKG